MSPTSSASATPSGMVDELARTEGLRLGQRHRRADRGSVRRRARRSSRRNWPRSRLFVGARPNGPRTSTATCSTRSASAARATGRGSATWRWPATSRRLADELARLAERAPSRSRRPRAPAAAADAGAGCGPGSTAANALDAAMTSMGKSLFFKDKALVGKMLRQWRFAAAGAVAERVGELERSLMRGDAPPPVEALGEELIAIARSAQRRPVGLDRLAGEPLADHVELIEAAVMQRRRCRCCRCARP